ncbi:Fatty acid transporter protein-like protein [Emericellopsis cladophorae]|uniref:Very long-chain fatty acid transport protein n=1 Tax=Emericellopsis cladophorae TaxID=2686198 RepID=A0A9P9Y386_9HYPO|nr:Fatty acid transporter protein-like protein [Emericellopsis cladophorae]KAI6782667.1 Fatty acid transporter protein-like protein [Emericellopsis cladophorae]
MPVPLAIAAPAAAAALAYVNARGALWNDLRVLDGQYTALVRTLYRMKTDRLNVFYLLEEWAQSRSHAHRNLVLFEGKRHTYAQVYDRVLRYGTWMKENLGVKSGDIVAMDFQNSDSFIFVWFALWAVGAKPAFINYNLTGNALTHCIKVAETSLCLVDPAVEDNVTDDVKAENPGVKFVTFTPETEAQAFAAPPNRLPDEQRSQADYADMAILIYTSGTTGLPKPAIVSWSKCIGGAGIGDRVLRIGKNDIVYTSMPLYHSAAAVLSFLAVLHAGSTQALGRKFSTKSYWSDVREMEATVLQYVGETLRYLVAAPPQIDTKTGENLDKKHKVRLAYGNGLRPDVWRRFQDRFGVDEIGEMYAATEGTAALINMCANDLTAGAMGRTGWLTDFLMSRSIAVVEVDWATEEPARDPKTGLCRRVKNRGDPGEMLFQLPSDDPTKRFQGYYKNPQANAKKLMRNVLKEGDAWFRTGDVVRWDTEGRIWFNDRIGDTFRWKSENVSTSEVSEAVGMHPAVKEANVYGVELPHHDGRAGCAAVYLYQHAPLDETLRSLAEHTRSQLPKYAVPLFLRVVKGDPGGAHTTGTNKQQKHFLRQAGVKPDPATEEELGELYWLATDGYRRFGDKEWRELEGGRVKL